MSQILMYDNEPHKRNAEDQNGLVFKHFFSVYIY